MPKLLGFIGTYIDIEDRWEGDGLRERYSLYIPPWLLIPCDGECHSVLHDILVDVEALSYTPLFL